MKASQLRAGGQLLVMALYFGYMILMMALPSLMSSPQNIGKPKKEDIIQIIEYEKIQTLVENLFVLVNTPPHRNQDWESLARELKAKILKRLSRELNRDINFLIEEELLITPRNIEENTGSTCGSLYGIASNSRFSAFLRHPNRSRRIPGLYFAGGSSHPGGGMPLALLSGTLAARLGI